MRDGSGFEIPQKSEVDRWKYSVRDGTGRRGDPEKTSELALGMPNTGSRGEMSRRHDVERV